LSTLRYPDAHTELRSTTAGARWISLHVFVHDFARLSDFVLTCLGAMPLAFGDECFFIRYWLGGPHVRIRFKTERFRPILESLVHDYLQHNAFESQLAPESYYLRFSSQWDTEGERYWHGNGEFHYIAYRAETQRYGGAAGLALCENYFVQDSKAILEALRVYTEPELEKLMFGYCLVQTTQLRAFGLYEHYLEAACGVCAPADLPTFLSDRAGSTLARLRPQLLKVHASFLDDTYFPQELRVLEARLRALMTGLIAAGVVGIALIIHSVLHMSFNRAGITPAKEENIRLFAMYATSEDV
jgi:thiopeptide-type bacteriocin biosynthesis protein